MHAMPPETPPDPASPEPSRRRGPVGVIALALIGLVLVAGVTYAASTLVSQPIGLTSEPLSAGETLAPTASTTTSTTATTTATTPRTVTTTVTTPVPPPATGTTTTSSSDDGDDHGGKGRDDDRDDRDDDDD